MMSQVLSCWQLPYRIPASARPVPETPDRENWKLMRFIYEE
jgi:hypothetical protein